MSSNEIHSRLLDVIKDRLQPNNVTNRLMDILCIGKEAIYRRLRGEVSFSLEEIAAISTQLGISIDDIIGSSSHANNRSFQLKTTAFVDPSPADYFQMREWIELFQKIVQSPNLEMGESGNIFDSALIYPYQYLSRFYHFKWQYQWRGKEDAKHFQEIKIPKEHRELQLEHTRLSREVKNTYYIWDHMIFQYIINDISYFRDIQLIDDNDIANIKKDLLNFVDFLESIARKGCFETGNSIQLYISNTNSDATYNYYQCEFFNLAIIKAFTLNALASTNPRTTNEIKEWILSHKRQATLISESGEIQRISFFKKQREIIDTIQEGG